MAWDDLLKNGMDIFEGENAADGALNFTLNEAVDPFPSYCFIYNCEKGEIEYTSSDIKKVLGYESSELDIKLLFEYIHPDDQSVFIRNETKALEFCQQLDPELQNKYYVVHDFRMKTKAGDFVRIQQRSFACEVKNDVLKKTLVVHTDISTIKSNNESVLHFIGMHGAQSYYNAHLDEGIGAHPPFSKKELEILRYMVQGKKSEEIAQLMSRSIFTIRNHRKKILQKSDCKNIQELLLKAVKETWV